MKLDRTGIGTSAVEVTNVSTHGIWILVRGAEYFMDYDDFPWFRTATLVDLFEVQLLNEQHLHWPRLDVDLDLESLKSPQAYPLVYR